jgi:flagellar basal body-associated protein FliL
LHLSKKASTLTIMTLQNKQRMIIILLYVAAFVIASGTGCLLWMSPTGTQQSGDKNSSQTSQP